MKPINLVEMPNGDVLIAEDRYRQEREVECGDLVRFMPVTPSVAIDVGACVGAYSKTFARLGWDTHAFEARLDAFLCLCANTREFRNCRCYHAIVGTGEPCSLDDAVPEGDIGRRRVHKGGEIPSIAIDSLNLQNVGFIKADVEGFEAAVIEGAKNTIVRCRPIMYIEVFAEALATNGSSEIELLGTIKDLGYAIKRIDDGYPYNILCTPL